MHSKKVRRGYLIDNGGYNRTRRILIDDLGFIFYPGSNGWYRPNEEYCKIKLFPGEVTYNDWWDGWWSTNWKMPDWGWVYGNLDLINKIDKLNISLPHLPGRIK